MTCEREPVTIEDRLRLVYGTLKMERVMALTGKSEGYLTALTLPRRRETLSFVVAELLDLEYHRVTGQGFPLYEALGLRLETAGAGRFAEAAAIAQLARQFAKEGGEATAAMVDAAMSSGDPDTLKNTLRELEDADRINNLSIAAVRQALAHARDGPAPAPD